MAFLKFTSTGSTRTYKVSILYIFLTITTKYIAANTYILEYPCHRGVLIAEYQILISIFTDENP